MSDEVCPFCSLSRERVVLENALAIAFRDGYPVSEGHTLVVPRRHVTSFFETSEQEQAAMFDLLRQARAELDASLRPAGYNVGINDGAAAGQTVMHVHVHLIPRHEGDRDDPRGGVRWVMPEKADYWSKS